MHVPARRRFLNRVTVAAGSVALTSFPLVAWSDDEDEAHTWRGERRIVKPGRQFFPQGVASFDPRPDSVLLWTRVEDPGHAGQDAPITLLVSTDSSLRRIVAAADVNAHAADEGVVQVKLTELQPKRHYWYRFVYQHQGKWYGSAIGRTKTAPSHRDASPVRFALASCQNAIGRFYNAYLAALPQELDLVVFVGDYIYETTGDPSLQTTGGRRIDFTDTAGAIALKTTAGATFYAAASLSNYRELYRFYRSDAVLQRMHQRFPFVNIWDDHEFSNDSHGATATYFDGRRNELNVQRRRNAERAFFEYIAVDDELPEGPVDLSRKPLYPETRLYRDFRYGKNLHLVMTDTRTFRPDHLIPEDAFPGTVAIDRPALTALLGAQGIPYEAVAASFAPYINIDAPAFALYKAVLTQVLTFAYAQQGLSAAEAAAKAIATVRGNLDANVLNTLFASVPGVPPIPTATLDRGLSFALMGKATLFSTLGARYLVAKDTFDLYAAYRTLLLGDASAENMLGDVQLAWLESTLRNSDARWKVVANSVSFTSMILDLRGFPQLPAPLRNRFYLNVDQFDGFPNYKRRLLELFSDVDGVALLAGDIHASFATEHAGGLWEFTGPAVSSFVFFDGLRAAVLADPILGQVPGIDQLVAQLDALLAAGNPAIRYVNTKVNGVVVLEASAARLSATYWQLEGSAATASYYERPLELASKLSVKQFSATNAIQGQSPDSVSSAARADA